MTRIIAGIISFNGLSVLPECINSCKAAGIEQILVIDNHSRDGIAEYLLSLKDSIVLLRNDYNTGFTNAANQAIEYAHFSNFDYLLLLNQDTAFGAEMIPHLQNSFEENSALAIVSPLHINEQNQPEYQFELNCSNYGIDINSKINGTIEVPFVNAACWMMDLKKVRDTGKLLTIFKNYGSDLNYCNRVEFKGYKIGINMDSMIIHKKPDKDYQDSFLKSIKLHNAYYLAMVLNPSTKVSVGSLLSSLSTKFFYYLLRLRFRKAFLIIITQWNILTRRYEIERIQRNEFG